MAKGKLETSATARSIVYGNGVEVIGDTYALTNTHGDVKKLVDTVGNVVESYIYDAFGNVLNMFGTSSTSANDILYASEQYDSVTGTYYLRARNYDPRIGRFTGEDDYHGDGRNLYTYVGNNPLRFTDPSGYCKENKVSGWKWALDGLKIIGGAVLCATGVGTAVGVSLIVSGVGDVVVDVMTECGASGKKTAIVSDGIQIVSGVAMLLNPVTAEAGAASIGSGVGGLAGGFAREAIYEAVTGEQSDTAFAIGSSVGNILGGIAGDQVGKAIEAKNNLELVKAATSVEFEDLAPTSDVADTGNNIKDLFRAVSPEEFEDVMVSGKFRGIEGKTFAAKEFGNNFDDTLAFANQSINSDKAAIVKVSIPTDIYEKLNHMELDAYFFRKGPQL